MQQTLFHSGQAHRSRQRLGPAPDLYVVVWWQDLAQETNIRLGGVSVRAWIVSVATIALCLLAMVVDTRDPRQRRKS